MWHSLLSYHPRIGYTYTQSVTSRVPFENGGYLVRTNATGFRSDCEFSSLRNQSKSRALLFGDSMTSGDGVSNPQRFSDLLQKMIPDLEVFNYGLAGGGTDQHFIAYSEFGSVQNDLLIIAVNVENISRVNARFLEFQDANGKDVFYAKPYFEIEKNALTLKNVPVPKRPWTKETLPREEISHVDCADRLFPGLQNFVKQFASLRFLRQMAIKMGLRDLVQAALKTDRVPGYETADNPSWLILRRVLEEWIIQAPVPVLLVPIPSWTHYSGSSDPTGYQTRFRELASDLGCLYHDPLPHLMTHSPEERRSFRFKQDIHFSPKGHQALAESLAPVVGEILKSRANDHRKTGVTLSGGFRQTSPSRSAKTRNKSRRYGLSPLVMSCFSGIRLALSRMGTPRTA